MPAGKGRREEAEGDGVDGLFGREPAACLLLLITLRQGASVVISAAACKVCVDDEGIEGAEFIITEVIFSLRVSFETFSSQKTLMNPLYENKTISAMFLLMNLIC